MKKPATFVSSMFGAATVRPAQPVAHHIRFVAVLAIALFASKAVLAEDAIQSFSHGSFELPLLPFPPSEGEQIGELVTCPGFNLMNFAASQHLLRVTSVYDRYEGVCDDLGPVPCAGRLLTIQESCTANDDNEIVASIGAGYAKGARTRICWDPSGAGQCTAEYEVATGEGLGSQIQRLVGAPTAQGRSLVKTFGGPPFRVDGQRVRIAPSVAIGNSLFENFEGADCILPPPYFRRPEGACGIATAAFSSVDSDAGDDQN